MDERDSRQFARDARWARRYRTALAAALAVMGLVELVLLVRVGFEPVRRARGGADVAGVLYLAGNMAVIGLWLRWFRAVYRAAGATGLTRHDSFMVVAGWLVPVLWLFVPKRMVDDVWRAGGDRKPLPSVVRWWWRLWCAAMAVATVELSANLFLGVPLADVVGGAAALQTLLDVLAVPFAVGTVVALTGRLDRVEQWTSAPAWPEPLAGVARATAQRTP